MTDVSKAKALTFIFGLYLILEGLGSLIVFSDQDPVFQAGRLLRVGIGVFMIGFIMTRLR